MPASAQERGRCTNIFKCLSNEYMLSCGSAVKSSCRSLLRFLLVSLYCYMFSIQDISARAAAAKRGVAGSAKVGVH